MYGVQKISHCELAENEYIITTGPNKEEKMSERPPEEPPFFTSVY